MFQNCIFWTKEVAVFVTNLTTDGLSLPLNYQYIKFSWQFFYAIVLGNVAKSKILKNRQ